MAKKDKDEMQDNQTEAETASTEKTAPPKKLTQAEIAAIVNPQAPTEKKAFVDVTGRVYLGTRTDTRTGEERKKDWAHIEIPHPFDEVSKPILIKVRFSKKYSMAEGDFKYKALRLLKYGEFEVKVRISLTSYISRKARERKTYPSIDMTAPWDDTVYHMVLFEKDDEAQFVTEAQHFLTVAESDETVE